MKTSELESRRGREDVQPVQKVGSMNKLDELLKTVCTPTWRDLFLFNKREMKLEAEAELIAIRGERDEAVQACVNAAAYLVAVHNKIQPEMTDEQVLEMLDKAVVKSLRLP